MNRYAEKPLIEINKATAQRFVVLMNAYNKHFRKHAPPGTPIPETPRLAEASLGENQPEGETSARHDLLSFLMNLPLVQLHELQVMVRIGAGDFHASQWSTACESTAVSPDRRAEVEKLIDLSWQNKTPVDGLSAMVFEELI